MLDTASSPGTVMTPPPSTYSRIVAATAAEAPRVVVIDSIQTMATEALPSTLTIPA